MATRITKGGLQSYDPLQGTVFKKKKKPPLKFVDPKVAIARAKASGSGVDKPEVTRDAETGELSGLRVGDKTFLGLDPEEIATIAAGEKRKVTVPEGAVEAGTSEKERKIEKEKEEIIEEESPERPELGPEERGGETVPVLGAEIAIIQNLMEDSARDGLLGRLGIKAQKEGWLQPEVYKDLARTEIEKKVFEEGVTASEKFGAFIESIPVLGFVSKYVGGLVETPYGNIQEMRKNIRKEKVRATNAMTLARTGSISPEAAMETIREVEGEINRLESRIKLLVNFSGQLRFNSDQINTIETEILTTKEILLEAKLRASEGAITDPTEMELLMQLNKGEDEEL